MSLSKRNTDLDCVGCVGDSDPVGLDPVPVGTVHLKSCPSVFLKELNHTVAATWISASLLFTSPE